MAATMINLREQTYHFGIWTNLDRIEKLRAFDPDSLEWDTVKDRSSSKISQGFFISDNILFVEVTEHNDRIRYFATGMVPMHTFNFGHIEKQEGTDCFIVCVYREFQSDFLADDLDLAKQYMEADIVRHFGE